VRPRITIDFLRGFLAAYLVHECYEYALAAPLLARQHPELATAVTVFTPLFVAVHVYVLVALIVGRHAKATFVILLLLAAVPFLGLLPNAPGSFLRPGGSHLSPRRVAMLIVHALSAVVAHSYYRRACVAERPNQTMQPTASPRTASLSDE
jgi:hypothetical protein